MARKMNPSSYAAIPAILALAGAAFVMKPEELRRDPLLETQGLIGMAAKYEVMYSRCDVSAATGFAGGFSHRFPARSDQDAALFVLKARPQCDVASLYRLDGKTAGAHHPRYRRIRIEV
ncbi:hypothetical protein [Hyphococcus sp.]|uniref:hypothetical protein n=1 Tax=Hyphococcus sp. TaxID=2038636 RepID=UPI0035C6C838